MSYNEFVKEEQRNNKVRTIIFSIIGVASICALYLIGYNLELILL